MGGNSPKQDHITLDQLRSLDSSILMEAVMARCELAGITAEELIRRYREQLVETLITDGLTMIPCDSLQDHMVAVSPAVYAAAKEHLKKENDLWITSAKG